MKISALLAALLVLIASALPASAHRLKLFARLDGPSIVGYAFYIGGGRPQGSAIVVTDAGGAEVGHLVTAADGSFSYTPGKPGTYTLRVAAGDGHFAETTVGVSDLGGPAAPAVPVAVAAAPAAAPVTTGVPDDLDGRIARAVDAAVSRQIAPLLEAYDAADGRVRFNDLVGGLGWIVGLAGLYLWLSGRRKPRDDG